MGQLTCKRCGAKAEADTIEAADVIIDHGVGKSHGRPCAGEPSDMRWNGALAFEKKYIAVSTSTPKPRAAAKAKAITKAPPTTDDTSSKKPVQK